MIDVGITTTVYGNNFGEFLQAFAIRKAINDSFGDCHAELINFCCKQYHPYQKEGFENYLQQNAAKDALFREFRENEIGLTGEPTRQLTVDSAPEYDVYVFGSDGIWNTGVWEIPEFFGSFVPQGKRKVAYAPSVGTNPNNKIFRHELFEEYIPSFSCLSVREEMHRDYVNSYAPEKKVELVCDPTLLLTKDEYYKLAKTADAPKPDRPYIFFYQPHAADCAILSLVVKLARMYGFAVVHTFADIPDKVFPHGSISARFAGPREFLSYISDASIVVTRSYHAAIFSMIFENPVYAFADKKTGSRFESLFSVCGMENHLIHNYIKPEDVCLEYDYDSVRAAIGDFRAKSLDYLDVALHGDKEGA